jgi:hypothetical protein
MSRRAIDRGDVFELEPGEVPFSLNDLFFFSIVCSLWNFLFCVRLGYTAAFHNENPRSESAVAMLQASSTTSSDQPPGCLSLTRACSSVVVAGWREIIKKLSQGQCSPPLPSQRLHVAGPFHLTNSAYPSSKPCNEGPCSAHVGSGQRPTPRTFFWPTSAGKDSLSHLCKKKSVSCLQSEKILAGFWKNGISSLAVHGHCLHSEHGLGHHRCEIDKLESTILIEVAHQLY